MSAGARFTRFTGIIVLVLCFGVGASPASSQTHSKHKKAQPQLPTLPSGPTGHPVPQLSLDSIAPLPPRVTYEQGQLTIIAANSTLGDVLRAVRKSTGAEIDVPDAKERVVTHLGPGPAQEIVAELLNGSRFNYVLLGSPQNAGELTRVVLVARSGGDNGNRAGQPPPTGLPGAESAAGQAPEAGDDAEAQPPDETPDENADQAAAEQEPPPAQLEQPGVKTPQELLQEMQQRQLQMQQQAPGQVGAPGVGPPVRPQQPEDK